MVAMSIERLKKVPENHGKDDTSVRYQWRKDDTSVVYSAQIGDNLVMPYTITSIRLLKEYRINSNRLFFFFKQHLKQKAFYSKDSVWLHLIKIFWHRMNIARRAMVLFNLIERHLVKLALGVLSSPISCESANSQEKEKAK
jgi:hypothetical protein